MRTSGGTVRFDGRTFVPVAGFPAAGDRGAAAGAELRDRDGNLWVGSLEGLVRFSPPEPSGERSQEVLRLLEGPSPVRVTCLLEDREGSLWIGTAGSGLFRLNDGAFLLWGRREGLPASAARTVIRDHGGDLWIGTDGAGLLRLRGREVTTYSTADGLGSDVVLTVVETEPGTLWIGTAGGGLHRLRQGEITRYTTRDGLSSAVVTSLLGDRQGGLWIGTLGGGLNRFRRGMFDSFTTADGLSNDIVRALLQDRDGDLWIGTDAGLNRFRNGQITSFSTADGLAGDQILALYEDRDGVLWAGTDAGLSRKLGAAFLSYTQRQGLFNDGLRQILGSGERLWLCSNKGLFSQERPPLAALPGAGGDRLVSRPLPGARDLDCSGYSQPAAWRGDDGRMWFATSAGVVELDPKKVSLPPAPPVVLERVLAGGQNLSPAEPGRLPTGVRDVEFAFAALDLFHAPRARFRYRLEPFDDGWVDNGDRRSARYTNLPAGSFRFRVAASTGGPWSRREAIFQLYVPKPFYRTQPAIAGALLLGLMLSRGAYRLRTQHLVRRNRRLARQIAESTHRVDAQRRELDRATQLLEEANHRLEKANEELLELDRENTELLALAAHDLREPLVTLRGFASEFQEVLAGLRGAGWPPAGSLPRKRHREIERALGEDVPEALGFIESSTERMEQLIQGLLSLSQLGRQELHFEDLDVDELVREVLRNLRYQISRQGAEVEVRSLPPVVADRASLKLIFENLLSNAVNYLSPERPGRIVLSGEAGRDEVTYRVADNGRGISDEARTKVFQLFGRGDLSQESGESPVAGEGLGLTFVRATVERLGGTIDFESSPGEGTTFFFTLPHRPPEGEGV